MCRFFNQICENKLEIAENFEICETYSLLFIIFHSCPYSWLSALVAPRAATVVIPTPMRRAIIHAALAALAAGGPAAGMGYIKLLASK